MVKKIGIRIHFCRQRIHDADIQSDRLRGIEWSFVHHGSLRHRGSVTVEFHDVGIASSIIVKSWIPVYRDYARSAVGIDDIMLFRDCYPVVPKVQHPVDDAPETWC